jgi:hypothetical protein
MLKIVQETRFDYKGFPCVVLLMHMGYRCGYVGLPKGHKYYGKDYNDIPVGCHGGLTYGCEQLHFQTDKDMWWIGFDCYHACDIDCIRTLDYCIEQCKQIVDQILSEVET